MIGVGAAGDEIEPEVRVFFRSREQRLEYCLRNLVMALAHNARADGKDELADELESLEESLQRNIQPGRTREKVKA